MRIANKSSFLLFIMLCYLGITFMAPSATASEPQAKIQDKIIIDVRTPKEFAENSNPTSINIPLDELESKISTIDKNKTVVVCCVSGRRSAIAASILKKHGFKHVIDAGPWRNTLS